MMLASATVPSKDYVECARRLRQLHELIRSGDGDSVEADGLRDEMDDYWYRMGSEERGLSGELSADLNALGDILRRSESRVSDVELRRQFLDAEYDGAWDRVRNLIEAGSDKLGASDQILFRACYWGGRGDFESGYLFLKFFVSTLDRDQDKLNRQYVDLRGWFDNLGSDPEERPLREKAVHLIEEAEKVKRRSNDSVDLLKYQIEHLGASIEFDGDPSTASEQDRNEVRLAFFTTCSSAFLLPAA
jgi:hypothetical protein